MFSRLFSCCIFFLTAYSSLLFADHASTTPNPEGIGPIQPEWVMKTESFYPGGQASAIGYYEIRLGQKILKRRHLLYPNGRSQCEAHVVVVSPDSLAYTKENQGIVADGAMYYYYEQGTPSRCLHFNKGVAHGKALKWYPSGQLQEKGQYVSGKTDGAFEVYYQNGKVAKRLHFKNGKRHGLHRHYNDQGQLVAEFHFKDDKLHGLLKNYNENGVLVLEKNFSKGVPQSSEERPAVIRYTSKGKMLATLDYHAGKLSGKGLEYHPNGTVAMKMTYVDGQAHGMCYFYNSRGKKSGVIRYNNGKITGKVACKADNGTVILSCKCDKRGNMLEPLREFTDSGVLIREEHFDADFKPHGVHTLWFNSGKVKEETSYSHGELHGLRKLYYENGQLKEQSTFNQGQLDGSLQRFYINGQMKESAVYLNGQLDQAHCIWDENGNKLEYTEYSCGELISHEKWHPQHPTCLALAIHQVDSQSNSPKIYKRSEYYSNGQLKSYKEVCDDKPHGKVQVYSEEGQLLIEENYDRGLGNGDFKEWSKDGQLLVHRKVSNGKPFGVITTYYLKNADDKAQQIRFQASFDGKGQLSGTRKEWYKHGQLKSIDHFKDGKLHGMSGKWDADGNLELEVWYIQDQIDGRCYSKSSNGLETIAHYKKGVKEGLLTKTMPHPRKKGEKVITLEANYHLGHLEGEYTMRSREGKLIGIIPFSKGNPSGQAQYFAEEGHLLSRVQFKDGKRSGISYQYFPSGAVAKEVPFEDDQVHGEVKDFHENKSLYSVTNFVQGVQEGKILFYNPQGVCVYEGMYKKGQKHGVFKKYYDNGKIRAIMHYLHDKLEGKKESYDAEGKKSETLYHQGLKQSG